MTSEFFRKSPFFIYLIGQTVSSLGDGVYVIAFMSLTLRLSNGHGIALGGIFSVYTVGELVFGFIAGPIADSTNKKRMLVLIDILRGSILIILYVLVIVDGVQLLHIYLCTFAFAALSSFFHRIEFTILPLIVDKSELLQVNAILTCIKRLMKVISPALGGIIIQAVGTDNCFLFDSVSFMFSSLCISFLKYRNKHALYRTSTVSDLIGDMKNGFQFVLKSPFFLTLAIYAACINFVGAPLFPLLPLLCDITGNGASHYGMMLSGLSAGFILSSFLIVLLDKYLTKVQIMLSGLVTCSIAIIMIAIILNISVSIMACFVLGLGLALSNLPIQTLLQEQLPPNIIGVVSSFIFTTAQLAMPISMLLSGFLAESVKITAILEALGVIMFIGASIGFFLPQLKVQFNSVSQITASAENRPMNVMHR